MEWGLAYLGLTLVFYAVPLAIVVVNFISNRILMAITAIEKRQSKPEEVYSTSSSMFILSFINTALVI